MYQHLTPRFLVRCAELHLTVNLDADLRETQNVWQDCLFSNTVIWSAAR